MHPIDLHILSEIEHIELSLKKLRAIVSYRVRTEEQHEMKQPTGKKPQPEAGMDTATPEEESRLAELFKYPAYKDENSGETK